MSVHVSDVETTSRNATTLAEVQSRSSSAQVGQLEAQEGAKTMETAVPQTPEPSSSLSFWNRFQELHHLPSWAGSVIVHLALILTMASIVVGDRVQKALTSMDAALVQDEAVEELVILEDPNDADRELAVGEVASLSVSGSSSRVGLEALVTAASSESKGFETEFVIVKKTPSTAMIPSESVIDTDLSIGNRLKGESARPVADYGEALNQLAKEILAQLAKRRVTVLWMFDESGSMKDDREEIRKQFDEALETIAERVPAEQLRAGDLEHAVIGFGDELHFVSGAPQSQSDAIGRAIEAVPIDDSGEERTMEAIVGTLDTYTSAIPKDRKILIVLATDESGDDGKGVELALEALNRNEASLFVLGRQSILGNHRVRLLYTDPVTKDHYWPVIRRGPEAAGLELLQWDGLYKVRNDEQPSGFAPYELARLAKETSGIFFQLPNEEGLRSRPRGEKAFSIDLLREYEPDLRTRAEYQSDIASSPLRRTLVQIIMQTKEAEFGFNYGFPVNYAELFEAINAEIPRVNAQLATLLDLENQLRSLESERDRENERRWQANYDLMLAMIVAFQVKAYEFRSCIQEMGTRAEQGRLIPKNPTLPGVRDTDWVLVHSPKPHAPVRETGKKAAEAKRLLNLVIERHPDTPWADLALITLNRGLSCQWRERNRHPDYDERRKLVPKF